MSSSPYPSFFNAWTRTSGYFLDSMLAANRAAAAAFGVPMSSETDAEPVERRIEPDSDLEEWDVEHDVRTPGELTVGDTLRFTKTISEDDVQRFASASGDTNPIHLDDEYAAETRFGGRIAHGILVSGLISAALARLPGNVIYLAQDVEFLKPVRIGDRITADVQVAEDFDDGRYRLVTRILDADEEVVIDGEAVVLID
ncbi:MaoC family dehydratase [Halomarina litorea]|uniref:MaoC family dehydratase n=1 Tax=Halomarina litorea TaxID=2961595 RepID=UPI0020C544C3|nr:MaoC family dehydratase [Halomarina sp. BCD28]